MDRRTALKSLIALAAAPAIIKVEMLMPVKPLRANDFIFDYATKTIKYTGSKDKYYTVYELYDYLTKLWDEESQFDGECPIVKETDHMIKLNGVKIDDETARNLYDGSIEQEGAIYTSMVDLEESKIYQRAIGSSKISKSGS